MTRDEAIKAAHKRGFHSNADAWISLFVDLGLLKLDEPKSAEDRAVKVLSHYAAMPLHVIHDLAVEGLKIVEK